MHLSLYIPAIKNSQIYKDSTDQFTSVRIKETRTFPFLLLKKTKLNKKYSIAIYDSLVSCDPICILITNLTTQYFPHSHNHMFSLTSYIWHACNIQYKSP